MFHAWRSFHFDETVETIDAYVQRIRQVAAMLNYGEPQILEVFKNTLPSHLYWVLISIDHLMQAVETGKRIISKESNIDSKPDRVQKSHLFNNERRCSM